MSSRKRILVGALVVAVALCVVGWWIFQHVYMPAVTKPSTVSAAEAGDLHLLQTLQQEGMSLDYRDPRKFLWTPLIAAIHAGNSNIVTYLLNQGVDINAQDASGKTALMWAVLVAGDDLSIVQMLLEKGARTDVSDTNGSTVVDFAKAHPQRDRLLLLLLQGHPSK